MNPTELRIGNYILMSGHINGGQVKQTESFNEMDEYFNLYSPIPLTEEWLVKFGYEKKWIHKYDWYIWELNNVNLSDDFRFKNDPETIKIKYVHQLQNLYKALTGEELEIKENVR